MSEPKMTDLARQEAEELTAEQAAEAQGGFLSTPEYLTDPRARGGEVLIGALSPPRGD